MRALLLVILGLAIGAVGATMIGNVLRMRDAYPRGVMVVMQHHLSAAQKALRSRDCQVSTVVAHMRRLAAVDAEIAPAFGADSGPLEAGFANAANALQDAVTKALSRPLASCRDGSAPVAQIAQRCDDCHQRYR